MWHDMAVSCYLYILIIFIQYMLYVSHQSHLGLGWDCGFRSVKSISGEKGLRTCQLKFFDKPGEHGMAYSCAREH